MQTKLYKMDPGTLSQNAIQMDFYLRFEKVNRKNKTKI